MEQSWFIELIKENKELRRQIEISNIMPLASLNIEEGSEDRVT